MVKKNNKLSMLYYLFTAFILFNIDKVHVFAKEELSYVKCGTSTGIPRPVPQLTTVAFTFLTIVAPLVLIAFSIVTLIKAIASSKEEDVAKAKHKLLQKLVIVAIVFLAAPIVKFTVNRIATASSDKNTFSKCLNCFLYYSGNNCPTDYKGSGNDVTSNIVIPPDPNLNQGGSNVVSNRTNISKISGSIENAPKENTILVGDSKTVGLCGWSSSRLYNLEPCRNYIAVAQGGMGSGWFESTAVHSIDSAVKNKKYNIIILMGTNDTANITNAVNTYSTIISNRASGDWGDDTIIFVSVTPVGPVIGGGMHITQNGVDTFNASIKSKIEAMGKNNVRYCDIVTGVNYQNDIGSDGVHYKNYDNVYQNIVDKCL